MSDEQLPTSSASASVDKLFLQVYAELRRRAHSYLSREAPGITLSTTSLVHEAYLRMVEIERIEFQDRSHFLAMAARAMRRVLVDAARARGAQKRGSGLSEDWTDALTQIEHDPRDLLDLDDALARLGHIAPRLSQIVELRFFGGLTIDETATVLAIAPSTVQLDWNKAKAWLYRELTSAE